MPFRRFEINDAQSRGNQGLVIKVRWWFVLNFWQEQKLVRHIPIKFNIHVKGGEHMSGKEAKKRRKSIKSLFRARKMKFNIQFT